MFNQLFVCPKIAVEVKHTLDFGKELLSHLRNKRKRYRGTTDGERRSHYADPNVDDDTSRKYPTDIMARLRRLAVSNDIVEEMHDATDGYNKLPSRRSWTAPGVVSNFVRKLVAVRDAKKKRELVDVKHQELATYLRKGLAAGTMRNFV